LLRKKFFVEALKLFFNPMDLLSRGGALLLIQSYCFRASKPPLRAVHDRTHHFQVADQFGASPRWDLLLSLRLEKQRRIVQNASPDLGRSVPPCAI